MFCDRGFFTPDESRAILEAGTPRRPEAAHSRRRAGGERRIAASPPRSARARPIISCRSTADGIAALARAGVVATLLPCAAFYLKLGRFAPARDLIAAGVPVALATDVNPGGGFSPSMPFAMTLACFGMGLTFEEALVAATINGAYSLDRHDRVGSLEPGKQFDAVLVDGPAINLLRVNASPIAAVFKKGTLRSHARQIRPVTRNLLDRASRVARHRRPAAARPRRSPARSAPRCSRWSPACRRRRPARPRSARRSTPRAPSCWRCARRSSTLIDRDAAAYDLVVAAYQLAEGHRRGEGGARRAAIQDAMRVATEVPLETIRACASSSSAARTVAEHGNPSAQSDAGRRHADAEHRHSGGVLQRRDEHRQLEGPARGRSAHR